MTRDQKRIVAFRPGINIAMFLSVLGDFMKALNSRMIFSCLFFVVLGFQNCGKIFSVDSPSEMSASSEGLNNPIKVSSLDSILQNNHKVDVLDYFVSSNIFSGFTNQVFFKKEFQSPNLVLVSAIKFNDPNNIEIFTADNDFIYIRYESTPEVYGGIKNSVRRFEGTRPKENISGVSSHIGNPFMGAIWTKRFLDPKQINVPIFVAGKVDHHNYNNNTILPGALSSEYLPMYIWYNFKKIHTKIPFVSLENQTDHKLVISQQWSNCNTEQYEYAIGVGYVGWRSLVSLHPDCSTFVNGHQNSEKIQFKNYMREGQDELYVVVQGMALSEDIDITNQKSPAKPSFTTAGIFLDDFPYRYTTDNQLLAILRSPEVIEEGIASPNKPPLEQSTQTSSEMKVRELYLTHLNRVADAAGLAFYKNLLESGTAYSIIRDDLRMSVECQLDCLKSNQERIKNLYLTYLMREPDTSGFNFYLYSLVSGIKYEVIRDDFRRNKDCKIDCL